MIMNVKNTSFFDYMIYTDLKYYVIASIIILVLLSLFFLIFFRRKLNKWLVANTDKQTKLKELNDFIKPAGFAYDHRKDIFYSLMYCWQRDYGYNKLYDEAAAPLNMIIDCEPIYFDYDGRSWLIELWKGQYGMTTGGEIGIYVTTSNHNVPDDDVFYESVSDNECLNISFYILKNNTILFHRKGLHWWLTGFKLGEFSNTDSLTMKAKITFPNKSMRNAFLDALFRLGYTEKEVKVRSLSVFILYDKPYSNQPFTRNGHTETIKQTQNNLYCKTYHFITKDYDNTLDKLTYLKYSTPIVYKHLLDPNKLRKLYKAKNKTLANNIDNDRNKDTDNE